MTAKKSLGEASSVKSMVGTNSVLIEVGGSIRRISLDDFQEAINDDKGELLQSVAWGVPIKQSSQSSPGCGTVGKLFICSVYKCYMGV